MFGQLRALLWAQFRTQRNYYLRSHRSGVYFTWLGNLLWYGVWVLQAAGAAYLTGGALGIEVMRQVLSPALFVIFGVWQLFPILLASGGAYLDLRRLLAYPIPPGELFVLEVALRISTGLEMLLVVSGIAAGLLWNPALSNWAFLPLAVFAVCNLFLAVGLRSVLERLVQRRGAKEIIVLGLIVLLLLPQWVAMQGVPSGLSQFLDKIAVLGGVFLWSAVGSAATGRLTPADAVVMAVWTAGAFWFARRQFQRTLRLDEGDREQAPPRVNAGVSLEAFYQSPSRIFRDPLAAVMEKDLRTLARAPRFRLILLMSCTMGQLLWLPLGLRSDHGFVGNNYLTLSIAYGMMVLGDVLFWNIFGMERGGVQAWFVTPVPMRLVVRAKNLVAGFYFAVSWLVICLLVLLLPVRIGGLQIAESIVVAVVMGTMLIGVGNLASVHMPRAVDPRQAWRNASTGKVQAFMLLVYPLVSIPVFLAYAARWATDSEWTFFCVLAIDLGLAMLFYWVATESAVEAAELHKEEMVGALTASQREGPMSFS